MTVKSALTLTYTILGHKLHVTFIKEKTKYLSLTFWTFIITLYRALLHKEVKKPKHCLNPPNNICTVNEALLTQVAVYEFNIRSHYLQTALHVPTQKEQNYWMESQGLPVLALFWDPRSRRDLPLGVSTCVWCDQNRQPSGT